MIKESKGITLVSLMITIALMLIISSITISVSMDRFEINDYNKMINDLKLLEDKVSNYYLKYNVLPIARNDLNEPIEYSYTTISFNTNNNDVYYILDLEAMEGISLNYGETGFNNPNSSDDVYIINEKSHQIYYVKGVELRGTVYHTIVDNNTIRDKIPPSKPEIKVISGTLNDEGKYITEVKIEIVPGKDNWSGVLKTEYSIDGGTIWNDIADLENNLLQLTEEGSYNIMARTYDENQNVSTNAELTIERINESQEIANEISNTIE